MDTCSSPKSFIMLPASCSECYSSLFSFMLVVEKDMEEEICFDQFYEEKGNNTETLSVKYATCFIEIILFSLDFIYLYYFILPSCPHLKNTINNSAAILGPPSSVFRFNP